MNTPHGFGLTKTREIRLGILRRKAQRFSKPIFYVNRVGGQDGLVFDGQSLAIDVKERLVAIGRQFEEDLVIADLNLPNGEAAGVRCSTGPIQSNSRHQSRAG